MKLKNIAAKFASGLLITSMIFSLVACGEKESDEKDDKKDKKKVEKTVDELMSDMNKKSTSLSTEKFEKALEDDCITYEEFEDALKSISSCKGEATFDLEVSMEAEADGEKEKEKLGMDFTYLVEYDSDNMSFHLGLEADMKSSEESELIKTDIYLVNEDGKYYGYTYSSDDGVAYRTEIGDIKEMFGNEGITKDQLEELFDEMDIPMSMDELVETMNMEADSEYMDAICDQLSLAKKYVEYKGKDYYDLVMNLNTAELFKKFKDNDEVKDLLESMELDSVDELLEMEVTSGMSVQDVLDVVKFKINYYIDPTDLFVAHVESDLKDCLNNCFDLAEKAIIEEAKANSEEDVDMKIDLNCSSAKFVYDFDNDADVTVKYEGEYEDAVDDEDDDWSDDDWSDDDWSDDDWSDDDWSDDDWSDDDWSDDSDDELVINGDTFDLYDYDDEFISSFTIPKGFEVDDISSINYYTLYDEDDNCISVYTEATYWAEELVETGSYESNLEDYTRDEVEELSSISTNKGKVRVFVNTWSFDENPTESYHQTYALVLEKGNELVASVEFYIDEIEAAGYTVESLAKTMFK